MVGRNKDWVEVNTIKIVWDTWNVTVTQKFSFS